MAAESAVQLGLDGEVYRNTGTGGSPTWVAGGLVRNVKATKKWKRADASARATRATLQAKTQIDITGTIEVRADPADAWYAALCDAAEADSSSAIDLMILDGPMSQEGARGVRACMNLDIDQDQNIDGVIYTTFAYDPAWNPDVTPQRVLMGATSLPTFTAY
jgi:hypothetical protein